MPSSHDPVRLSISRRRFLQGVSAGAAAAVTRPGTAHAQIQIDKELTGRVSLPIRLRVNGAVYRVTVEPRFTLLDVLRNQLDLTGTKRVCDRGKCGGCTVLLDGRPVYACMILALDVQDREIQTIESLAVDGSLDAIQNAFAQNDAFQCGFCTPGMVMSLKGLTDRTLDPTPDQIREAVSGNLCKCGCYTKVFRAARDAATALKARS